MSCSLGGVQTNRMEFTAMAICNVHWAVLASKLDFVEKMGYGIG